jgi:tetratricopeptide (TPR) repeat protein
MFTAILLGLLATAAQQLPSPHDLAGASTSGLSNTARADYARGHHQFRAGDFLAAVESFSAVIEQHPDFNEAYFSRAHAYRKLEQQATSVEDRDRYALGYISDEQRMKKARRSLLQKEWDEVLTKRVLALTVIYFVCWGLVFYFWWHLDQSLEFAAILVVVANIAAWSIPATPGRLPFGVGAVLFLILVAATKKPSRARELDDEAKERPTDFETATKTCPDCGRELNSIARLCPRCNHRF